MTKLSQLTQPPWEYLDQELLDEARAYALTLRTYKVGLLADDAVSEAVVRLLSNKNQPKTKKEAKAWLMRILKFVYINFYRRSKLETGKKEKVEEYYLVSPCDSFREFMETLTPDLSQLAWGIINETPVMTSKAEWYEKTKLKRELNKRVREFYGRSR